MGSYSILFRDSAVKELRSVPKHDLERIVQRVASLAEDPRPRGSEKLSGQERYRLRQGDYRIIYSIQDQELTIWIVKIGHRREVYR
jgi:mRNA interferase RelE/StbE